VAPGQSAADAGRAIDALFAERDVQTLSQDERAFVTGFLGMVSAVLDVLGVLSIVILVIVGLVLANAVAMGVRERTREYATLLAIGFSPAHVGRLVVLESVVVSVIGAVIGVAVARALVGGPMARFFEENLAHLTPVFRVTGAELALAFSLVLALGVSSAALPAARAARLRVTEALRRVA
jgi:putative ABC transport system permease protein